MQKVILGLGAYGILVAHQTAIMRIGHPSYLDDIAFNVHINLHRHSHISFICLVMHKLKTAATHAIARLRRRWRGALQAQHLGCSLEDLDSFEISHALQSKFKRKTSLLQLNEDGMQPNAIQ